MRTCRKCGARLRRLHWNSLQRFKYLAVYQCPECQHEESVPRFSYRLGDECCCPRCGTSRLTMLRERDRIDRMDSGIYNLLARLGGGKLYHCCFCRLQFYDRRPLPERTERPDPTPATEPVSKAHQ